MNGKKKEIVRTIKRLKRNGTPLNYGAVHKSHYTLVAHATEEFGSWKEAIGAAKLDYDKISKIHRWTDDEVLSELGKLYGQGKVTDVTSLSRDYPRLFGACRRHFGTGRKAFEAAGISYQQVLEDHPRRWTKAKIVAHLQQRYEKGKTLSRAAMLRREPKEKHFCYAAINHFGTWGAALKAAGFDPVQIRNRDGQWPRDKVLKEIRKRHNNGKLLHTDLMLREALPLHAAGRRHFGTWRAAVEKAGINYRQHVRGGLRGFSRARTLYALRRRLEKSRCSKDQVHEESPTLFRAAIHHFGTWTKALRAARRRS